MSGCVASNTAEENEQPLELIKHVLKADTTMFDKLDLEEFKRSAFREPENVPRFAKEGKEQK